MSLVIVDTGCANLASVKFAFDRLGVTTTTTHKADIISAADRVLIPGVGSAPFAMTQIKSKNLQETLRNLTQPVMGICLGMQLIFERSSENGGTDCLGLVPGEIKPLNTGDLPSPHMGWNSLSNIADDPVLSGVSAGNYAYFVHSYAAPIGNYTLASCEYGQKFSAVIRHENVWGCQFHPERSAKVGAQILKNFSEVTL